MKTNIEIKDAIKVMEGLRDNLEETSDEIARDTADMFIRDSKQKMRSNDSVETETGIKSLEKERLGDGKYGVKGAAYLEALDRGTEPHKPDTSSQRFISWAESNGFTPQELANIIMAKGTEGHEWIDDATTRTRKRKDKTAKIKIKESMKKTERMIL